VKSLLLPRRAYLGMKLASAASPGGGLPVRAVLPRSSAAVAGLVAGDVLTHLDANPIVDLAEARKLLRGLVPGDPLVLGVTRGGRALSLDALVVPLPEERHEGANVVLDQIDGEAGSLRTVSVVPRGAGPFPVVYFLPGAHWASEEYPFEPEHPVPALLGALAQAGIASVRVERSGVGDSSGPSCTDVDFATELAGYRAGLAFVRERPWAARDRVLLLAHSLGGMMTPLVARDGVAGVVVYAPSALPISEALVGALVRHAALSGEKPARTERIAALIRAVVQGGKTPVEVFAECPELAEGAPAHFECDHCYGRICSFYHQLEGAPIAEAYGELRIPLLFVHGGRDWICTAADAAALAARAGPSASVAEIPEADHHMSDAPKGAPPRLCSGVREAVLAFVRRVSPSA
jgi:pimeloyl-ACP methyl ester carboxylesterase